MTSTRDTNEPAAVAAGSAATDDTAGFDVVNTTRSNIPTKPLRSTLGAINPVGLGSGLVPSFGLPTPGGSVVGGIVPGGAALS
ncbi:MAG: hypothetical protein AB7R89_17710 [Dehalococcoidia bacterium]